MKVAVLIQHVVHFFISIFIIWSQADNLKNSTGSDLTCSTIVAISASLLTLIHLGLAVRSVIKNENDDSPVKENDDSPVENKLIKVIRHLAGTVALLGVWFLLGGKNQSGVKEEDWGVVALWFVTIKRLADVFLDMEKNIFDSLKVDCLENDLAGYKSYVVGGQLLLLASVVVSIMHQTQFDKDAGTRSKVLINAETANDCAFVLILVHAGLHPLAVVFDMIYSWWDADKTALSFLMNACRRKEKCVSEEEMVELVGFNRIPLVRQLVATTVLLLLGYAYGAAEKVAEGSNGYLFALLGVYVLTDALGRNIV
jgi:hypothetical protein